MSCGGSIPGFIYNCLEKPGFLLRRHYGFEIDRSFLYNFVYELYNYGETDAAEFIKERYEEMLRGAVEMGHMGIVKLLLGQEQGRGVTDELIDLAAELERHEIYLMLTSHRHSAECGQEDRFDL